MTSLDRDTQFLMQPRAAFAFFAAATRYWLTFSLWSLQILFAWAAAGPSVPRPVFVPQLSSPFRSSGVPILPSLISPRCSPFATVSPTPPYFSSRSLASSPSGHSCLSPLPSPLGELSFDRLPPPPTAASWAEFLNASANGKMESDFALLTLSDHEQRELYEAAKIIQTAFRKYKGRRLKEQQEMAAAVIQRCYRKYKQYALYKKMTQAAILIQSKFRSYYEQKKFQQSRRAAVLIQQYYRSYKEYEKLKQGRRASAAMQQKIKWVPGRLGPPERGTFLTKKQDQAARKIMRFLRRCRHR
uniref:Calmodulin binding transcription activator 2 n=1 Tax=Podarcis muralis TaxID=64176 RepID=A0A670K088_PODMU